MKTFEQYLHDSGTGGYPLRDILDNLTDEDIEDSVKEYAREYKKETVSMYKECLETFLPTDKWDEVTEFLSSYGNGLAKDMQRREK